MVILLVAVVVVFGGIADAQYENPYAIKPLQPLQPLGSTYSSNSGLNNSLGIGLPSVTVPRVVIPQVTIPSVTVPQVNTYRAQSPLRNTYSSEVSSYSYTNPASVVGRDGTYLGNTSANKFDPDSINNPYGLYGSKYSSESVNNPYGRFGSKYSSESANNKYTSSAPVLIGEDDGLYRGNLSANRYDVDGIENRYSPMFDMPLATQRQGVRTKIFDSYAKDPVGFIERFSAMSSADQAALLKILSD